MASIAGADTITLSVGNLSQYSVSLSTTPSLSGSRAMFTEPANHDGVDMVISDELRTSINEALNSHCTTIDSVCFDSIKSLLFNRDTNLEARQLTAGEMALAAIPLIALLFPIIQQAADPTQAMSQRPGATSMLHIPATQLSSAASVAQSSTFAYVTESAVSALLITPTPDVVTTTQSDAPRQTTLTESKDGHSTGDVALFLSADLAARLNSMINISKQCAAGAEFSGSNKRKLRSRDVEDQLGEVVCAAREIVLNAGPSGPFAELGLLEGQEPIWTNPDVQQAMLGVLDFAADLAVYLAQPRQAMIIIGAASFLLAYNAIVLMMPPSVTNYWSKTELDGTATASIGSMTTTATSTMSSASKNTFAFCLPNEDTKFPVDAFNKTYTKFCEKADGSKEDVTWMVNSLGEQSQLQRRRFWRRETSEEHDEYKFALWWRPNTGDNATECAVSCQESFQALNDNDSCKVGDDKKFLAGSGAIDIGCGTYSFAAHHQIQSTVECLNHPLDAPKNDKTASSGVSVESAIQTWCSDNDGHQFSSNSISDNVYWRWGITQLDVPDRRSFWLRAKPNGNNQQASFVKDECVAALTNGLSTCDPDSDNTHGFTATVGTIDYSLDLSGVTQLDNPPWNEHPAFPAPEFLTAKDSNNPYTTQCWDPKKYFLNRKIAPDDIEKAISAWCKDGTTIDGFGNNADGFMYPPEGEAPFYPNDHTPMHMRMNVATVKTGEKEPYGDMEWCE
ncbi:uncharacterized protein J4E84_006326 [Alternaria hordeiaustralica]|uniref:uncharacterized protein n=1 Tax=Alternaria hordeiaustralica TaxID=1187925 RepID=UPI0020C49C7D|nr:uncharacterized protein J4E84_006326 [Alternaria hordeiaustralica]KAI4684338.1 hypothetical protein J4E84_006326 [Alternaria hordeiaustralica]